MDFNSGCDKLLILLLIFSHTSNGTQAKPLTVDQDPVGNPVPYGHLPYHPSLPGAMGPQWSFPIEWWYYGGWAQSVSLTENQAGSKFTLYLETARYPVDGKGRNGDTEPEAKILYGIGTSTNGGTSTQFFANYSSAPGFHSEKLPGQQYGLIIPPTTQDQWYCEGRTATMQMTNQLIDGTLGLPGASYKLEMTDTSQGLNAVFILHDPFGAIIEFSSSANPTYEFALPCLNIMNESYIILNDAKYKLVDGNLWLDRQMVIDAPVLEFASQKLKSKLFPLRHQNAVSGEQLYVGNWLAIVMNNKTVYELLIFWPQKKNQWIVGDKLNPPIPPFKKYGVKYPYNSEWMNWIGIPAIQGVSVQDQDEFNLNIFNPRNPLLSPHWKSPVSGQTYCTKWQVELDNKQYVVTALVPEAEVTGGTEYFYEGVATITDSKDPSGQPVGYAMVEQMGYTQ